MKLTNQELEAIVSKVMQKYALYEPAGALCIPVEASARHVHLCEKDLQALFGPGASLQAKRRLSQPGQFLSDKRVKLVTVHGEFANVAVLGPARAHTQVELSCTDCRKLGIQAPLRLSGDLANAADVTIVGDCGVLYAKESVIIARAHVHMTPADAAGFHLTDGQQVRISINSERSATFDQVIVRISDQASLAMHIDYDEANACLLEKGMPGYLHASGMDTPAMAAPAPPTGHTAIIPAAPAATAPAGHGALITEEKAKAIVSSSDESVVQIARGTLITPSARDVFSGNKRTVVFV